MEKQEDQGRNKVSDRNRIKDGAYTVGFMCGVTFVAISVVSAIHLATATTVARNESLFMKRAICDAAGAGPFDETVALTDWYNAAVAPIPDAEAPTTFTVTQESGTITYIFVRSGSGLWGQITTVAGLGPELDTFTGVTFVKHNETPGLGARIDEAWFQKQFIGKSGPFTLVPEKTRSQAPTEIDAITGATITSKAVRDIMNELLKTAAHTVAETTKNKTMKQVER